MPSPTQTLYTPEQYLALERLALEKSKYINGRLIPMAGARPTHNTMGLAHNTITVNLAGMLRNSFLGRPCRGYGSDMRVRVSATGLFTYPDVLALCDDPIFDDLHRNTLLNPAVIFEVLSPSTEAYDRGEKFAHYRRLDSLTDYVMVSQDKCNVEHYVRQGAFWLLAELSSLDDTLHVASVEAELHLREIYDKVEFPRSRCS